MKMYGLFHYFYDWYEWESLVVVSTSKDALKAKAQIEAQGKDYEVPLACSLRKHKDLKGEEIEHLYIKEIEVI